MCSRRALIRIQTEPCTTRPGRRSPGTTPLVTSPLSPSESSVWERSFSLPALGNPSGRTLRSMAKHPRPQDRSEFTFNARILPRDCASPSRSRVTRTVLYRRLTILPDPTALPPTNPRPRRTLLLCQRLSRNLRISLHPPSPYPSPSPWPLCRMRCPMHCQMARAFQVEPF